MNSKLATSHSGFDILSMKQLVEYFKIYQRHIIYLKTGDKNYKLDNQSLQKVAKVLNFLQYQVFIFYKTKGFLAHSHNELYKSLPIDKCYEYNDYGKRVKIRNFDNFYISQILTKEDKKFFISFQMKNFLNDFILHKLFSVTKTDIKLSEALKVDLEISKKTKDINKEMETSKKLSKLNKQILSRITTSKGFYSIVITSKDSIPLFINILQKNIHQFYTELPSGNDVYDRQLKNILNVMKPNIATGYNAEVAKARKDSLKSHKVTIEYFATTEPYCIVNKLDNANRFSRQERLNIMLEVSESVPKKPFDPNKKWKPYTTNSLVLLLKNFSEALDGRIYLIDIINFLSESLKEANYSYWDNSIMSQQDLVYKGKDSKEVSLWDNLSAETNVTTGSSINYKKWEYRQCENFVNNFLYHFLDDMKISIQSLYKFSVKLKKALKNYEDYITKLITHNNFEQINLIDNIKKYFLNEKVKNNKVLINKLLKELDKPFIKQIENGEIIILMMLIENIENLNNSKNYKNSNY